MTEIAEAIRNDTVLQAIAIVVALASGLYYFVKYTLILGRSIWKRVSPNLSRRIERYLRKQEHLTNSALEDQIVLFAESIRRLSLIIFFITVYFILAIDRPSDAKGIGEYIATITQVATQIPILVAGFQLGSLSGWLKHIVAAKLNAKKDEAASE